MQEVVIVSLLIPEKRLVKARHISYCVRRIRVIADTPAAFALARGIGTVTVIGIAIGIAIGSGTEIAAEAADMVLMKDDLDSIITAIATCGKPPGLIGRCEQIVIR